jgi:hypothetical protein
MKTKEQANANLAASVTYIPERYKQGVSTADWATKAGSDQAEKNFADSMSQVIASKRRQTEVKKVSNATWMDAAITKGGAVIGQRVREALGKQSAAWNPIYDRVQSDVAKLPPKTTDFRANINNRVTGTVESWKKNSGKL